MVAYYLKPNTQAQVTEVKPYYSWSSIRENWRLDLVAGLSVALVALPLGLGKAIASGAPPVAGLIPAALGGLLTTFLRSSSVAINGPSNGLIVVTLTGVTTLGDGGGSGFSYVLAAYIMAGVMQLIAGAFKLGRYGDYMPSAVISGMLAAIGVIIMVSQVYPALGTTAHSHSTLEGILEIPEGILHANGIAVLITVISLLVMILHPRTRWRAFHFIPAPMWVMVVGLGLVYAFNIADKHTEELMGFSINVGPEFLIDLPAKVWEGLPSPNFGKIDTVQFWVVAFSVFLVASLEGLLSTKAVDKLDPQQRRTNLNRDLSAMGISTILSALIGGMPIITVILRSSINVSHGAKTRWSNWYHGVFLLVMVFGLGALIQRIPLAALATILVFSGFKLTSPKVFRDNLRKGWEQLALFIATLLAILLTGLLPGIAIGVLVTILLHWAKTGIPFKTFWRYIQDPHIRFLNEDENNLVVRVKGMVNFVNLSRMVKGMKTLPQQKHVVVDFSHARLIDYTTLEYMHEYAEAYNRNGGEFDLTGLAIHRTSSAHPYALHVLETKRPPRLSRRQQRLKQMAAENYWTFEPSIVWDTSTLRSFDFFARRPIEYKRNMIFGQYKDTRVHWEVADITFDEGALTGQEVYYTTIQVLNLPFEIPEFVMVKEGFLDKLLQFAGADDIDFERFREFSNRFVLQGPDEDAVREFFTPELIGYFEVSDVYHLECKGAQLLVFRYLRLASNREVESMIEFCEGLSERLAAESAGNGLAATPSQA